MQPSIVVRAPASEAATARSGEAPGEVRPVPKLVLLSVLQAMDKFVFVAALLFLCFIRAGLTLLVVEPPHEADVVLEHDEGSQEQVCEEED